MVLPTSPKGFSLPESHQLLPSALGVEERAHDAGQPAVETTVQSGDAWEVFSNEAQLELQLREAQDFSDFPVGDELPVFLENERPAAMERVKEIFSRPCICIKQPATQAEMQRACGMLLLVPSDTRGICSDQLCALTQGKDDWRPREILRLLEQLIAMPSPPIRQERCVAYLKEVMRFCYMRDEKVVEAYIVLRTAEQRIYPLSSNPETFQLFLQLLPFAWPDQHVLHLCGIIELFGSEAHKIIQYALVLHNKSPFFQDMLNSLSTLYETPSEERDNCMECLQQFGCEEWPSSFLCKFWKYLVKLPREERSEYTRLLSSSMTASWRLEDILSMFQTLSSIRSTETTCFCHFEAVITKSQVKWTAGQMKRLLETIQSIEKRIKEYTWKPTHEAAHVNLLLLAIQTDSSWPVSQILDFLEKTAPISEAVLQGWVLPLFLLLGETGVWRESKTIEFFKLIYPLKNEVIKQKIDTVFAQMSTLHDAVPGFGKNNILESVGALLQP